jgi:hypothetical protein
LAALVKARDGGCRFPGCTTSARFCDLDHVTPRPTGPTSTGNLLCLCRRHHRIKQRRGWTVRLASDGTATWTDPTGRTRSTVPQYLLGQSTSEAATRVPVDAQTVPANHPVAFGIQASDSPLEEDLDLALMLTCHQDAQRRHGPARHTPARRATTDHQDDRPPRRCRPRPHHDIAHPSTLRTWTLAPWPGHHARRTRRSWPADDDPPPF